MSLIQGASACIFKKLGRGGFGGLAEKSQVGRHCVVRRPGACLDLNELEINADLEKEREGGRGEGWVRPQPASDMALRGVVKTPASDMALSGIGGRKEGWMDVGVEHEFMWLTRRIGYVKEAAAVDRLCEEDAPAAFLPPAFVRLRPWIPPLVKRGKKSRPRHRFPLSSTSR